MVYFFSTHRGGAILTAMEREMARVTHPPMMRGLDGLCTMMVVMWPLLTPVTQGVPHRPRSAATLECIANVKEYARQYARSGCAKVLPYRLDVNELMGDCFSTDDEDLRVVISKIKQVGKQAFTGEGACLPWSKDSDETLLPPSTPYAAR